MKHHTTDPEQSAASIADRAAEKVWKQTGDWGASMEEWVRVYKQALLELAGRP